MSNYLVRPASLQGTVSIPPSKSQTLRAILLASLAKGKSIIHTPLVSPDTEAMIRAGKAFGAKILKEKEQLIIEGVGGKIPYALDVIDAGNSGIVLRFCAAIGALSHGPVVITGDHSIKYQRPMKELLKGLSQLGVKATSMRGDDYAPVLIQGPVTKRVVSISGEDSQPVSALLFLAANLPGKTEIIVERPGEIPWIGLTLSWLDRLGVPYVNEGFQRYIVEGGKGYQGFDYTPPGDFSSAAFPAVGALIGGKELTLTNLDIEDPQGDKELFFLMEKMGAKIEISKEKKELKVHKTGSLQGIHANINRCIDGVTALAVLGAYAKGVTRIEGAAVARAKECNRLFAITQELKKMGVKIEETKDGLQIEGGALKGGSVKSYKDHRMAMALSVAALGAEGETLVQDISCIEKTYPSFLRDFTSLGAKIEER